MLKTNSPTRKIQRSALEEALGYQEGMLIISFTIRSTLASHFFSINDRYLIDHSQSLSVMFINSKRDLYALCG